MATTDQKLVSGTLTGDTRAFAELVERYSGLVHGVVLGVVRRPEEVEDLVQEIFCKAYEQLPSLRRPSRFAPWLGRIARHQVLHWLRQRSTRSRTETEFEKVIPFSRPPLPDEDLETSERDQLLWSALDSLDPERRRLLVLYHLEGCTLKEIARFFNKPLTTIRWRLLQSERKLGQRFSALLSQSPAHLPVAKRELARQVLSLLPPTLYLASPADAAPWWDIRTWLQTARPEISVGLTGSALLHVAGLGLFGILSSESDSTTVYLQPQVGPELAVERLSGQIPLLPPAELLEQLPAPPDPPEPPEHMVDVARATAVVIPDSLQSKPHPITAEAPPRLPTLSPLDFPEEAHSISDDLQQAATSDSDQLDLLRLKDMARADRERSVAIPDEDAPGDLY
ncbi:MAG: sigma-70 family RNA polymerase sigma factor, partial [Gemmatimonadetes bacterium]|nr:sigma-70 family RNA polymerase sigma factor [Gemmatimonadota bacterium]